MSTEIKQELYSPEMSIEQRKNIPKSILKQIYDKNDQVLFGSSYIKGKVSYYYIPAENMTTGRPFIISTSILYDGKGNSDLPADAEIINFSDLPARFPDNEFKK